MAQISATFQLAKYSISPAPLPKILPRHPKPRHTGGSRYLRQNWVPAFAGTTDHIRSILGLGLGTRLFPLPRRLARRRRIGFGEDARDRAAHHAHPHAIGDVDRNLL